MSAITGLPAFFTPQFSTTWDQLVTQRVSKLKDRVTMTTVNGKERKFNQYGDIEMIDKVGRAAKTQVQDLPLAERWLRMKSREATTRLDEKDREYLGDVVLPTSEVMQAHVSAYMRKIDDVIISNLLGASYSGENGDTANNISDTVAVDYKGPGVSAANVGLNLAKIIQAKSKLGQNEVDDDEEFIFLYSQSQLDDLLFAVNQVSSADYNNVKVLVEGGKNFYFMGFKFVKTQRLPLNTGTDVRTCVAYVKSGIKFAENARVTHVDVLPEHSHAIQLRSVADMGAVRMEEKKVIPVYCDQSPP